MWTNKSKKPLYRAKIYSVNIRKILSNFYQPGEQEFWETPLQIKSAPLEIQKAYIRGFYDADGGCRDVKRFVDGFTKTINCEISIRCKHYKSLNEPLEFIKTFWRKKI